MQESNADLSLLIAELKADLDALEELEATNQKASRRISGGADDELDYAALGYTIHNLYNLIENSFYRIAKYFENNLSAESWHKDLINRMTLSLEGIRPAVIDKSTATQLDELRAFRHVFRNMYRKQIDARRIINLQSSIPETVSNFRRHIHSFIELLQNSTS